LGIFNQKGVRIARPAGQVRRSYTQWEYYFAMGERLDGSRQPPKEIFPYIGRLPVVFHLIQTKFLNRFLASARKKGHKI
jgi:hypothetical protein